MSKRFDSNLLAERIIEEAEVPDTRATPVVPATKTMPPEPLWKEILEEERMLQVDRIYREFLN